MKKLNILICILLMVGSVLGQEKLDYDVINRIKNEGLSNSQIEEITFYLTDYSGPRLSNSPGLKTAQEWAIK